MSLYFFARPVLMALEAETAHRATLNALKFGFGPRLRVQDDVLRVKLWGRNFPNPLGMAAGFDKDAEAIEPLLCAGFGFVEAGTVTPAPQKGNARPRVFRDVKNQSVLNRMGFPSAGLKEFANNIDAWRTGNREGAGKLGVNIGINKNCADPAEDYKRCIEKLAPLCDYIAVNVSSPNTQGLRDLQEADKLDALLKELVQARDAQDEKPPLLLKVAPDMDTDQRAAVAKLALAHRLDGLIVSNTTVARPARLREDLKSEAGGVSGRLLAEAALEALGDFYRLTQGALPLIGVGGVSSSEDAYARIRAGASLVQIYTALAFQGPRLVGEILTGLAIRARRDGFSSIQQAVGTGNGGFSTHKAAV